MSVANNRELYEDELFMIYGGDNNGVDIEADPAFCGPPEVIVENVGRTPFWRPFLLGILNVGILTISVRVITRICGGGAPAIARLVWRGPQ